MKHKDTKDTESVECPVGGPSSGRAVHLVERGSLGSQRGAKTWRWERTVGKVVQMEGLEQRGGESGQPPTSQARGTASRWKRRAKLGRLSPEREPGGSQSWDQKLLASIRIVLDPHRIPVSPFYSRRN